MRAKAQARAVLLVVAATFVFYGVLALAFWAFVPR